MSDLNGNVTSSVIGGSSLKARLDEVTSKLSNVQSRINELEMMIDSCKLNPLEIITFNKIDSDHDSDSSQLTTFERESIRPTSVSFVVSVPSHLYAELNSRADIEYSLRISKRELSDKVEGKKKEKGVSEQYLSEYYVS